MSARSAIVPVSEKGFACQVEQLAKLLGWAVYHSFLSVRSAAGFPDYVLVRPPRVIFAELKALGRKPTPAQEHWLGMLASCPFVEVFLWSPVDWDRIQQTLS